LQGISKLYDDTAKPSFDCESSTDNLRVVVESAQISELSNQACSVNISSQLKMLNTEREETEKIDEDCSLTSSNDTVVQDIEEFL